MTVARTTEITSTSKSDFQHAIQDGIERANKTLRNIEGVWIKDQQVLMNKGAIDGYRVTMKVTFVLDD